MPPAFNRQSVFSLFCDAAVTLFFFMQYDMIRHCPDTITTAHTNLMCNSFRQIDETIVALIDPDFIFLKPLTTWMNPREAVARGDGLSLEGLKLENGGWVRKGYPAGGAPFE